ncbi:unnamed protein product [Echinostoma caproni]|uniref:Mannosyl-glycoprotein endo-beta-N-acetylglucosaminidase n=1 Tax=Echinostoma caproni TaxID=27848 RepID=A0A183AQF9_9TREM|nr:unnamed protein product [Echinostoma caproni]
MKPAAPIKDLCELTKWKPNLEILEQLIPLAECKVLFDDCGRSYETLQKCPTIIYCHDMAGGYLDADREFGMTDVFPAFRFTRWHLIDIFIYFSHHFITLPPITWINLAHRYDSVTRSGKLTYQNALTEENQVFLNTGIDGIFLNYNWNDELLRLSQEKQKRRPDRPLSVALFAPGWPFENCDLSSANGDQCKSLSLIADWDDRFWTPLTALLPLIRNLSTSCLGLHRPTVLILPVICESRNYQSGFILETTCCTGQGAFISSGRPGSCMRMQQLMPTCRDLSPEIFVSGGTNAGTMRSFQTLHHACCGPIAPYGTCLLLRRIPLNRPFFGPRLVELFSFAPTANVSNGSILELTISLGCCSPATTTKLQPIKKLLRVLGLALFVDWCVSAVPGGRRSQSVCETICRRDSIPFEQGTRGLFS